MENMSGMENKMLPGLPHPLNCRCESCLYWAAVRKVAERARRKVEDGRHRSPANKSGAPRYGVTRFT